MLIRTAATVLSVVSVFLLLPACSRRQAERAIERRIEQETGGNADVDIQSDGAVKVETAEGTYNAGGNRLPEDWPEDAPVYAGAEVQFSGAANPANGKPGAAAVLITADSASDVLTFYKAELKSKGWTITTTMESQGTTIIGATKGARTFSLMIGSSDAGKTSITIGVGEQ
ncbi:hypothetical protein HYW84_00575 [Candidatus Peregrinibacteria bacterium]|nr:hypothetical protein [Candidatus Peregrinibacteria bacterium]